MKKLNLLLSLGVIIMALAFTSCNKDDDEPIVAPIISFDAGDNLVLAAGEDSATLTGTIKAEGKLKSIVIFDTDVTIETITDFDEGSFTSDDKINCNFRYGIGGLSGVTTIKFEVTDKESQTSAKSIVITVPALTAIGSVQLGASNSSLPSYYSVSTDETYSLTAARENADVLDFVFTVNGSEIATFISPKDAIDATISGTGRTTLYGHLEPAGDDVTIKEIAEATLTDDVAYLLKGDIIVFETEEEIRGAFLVEELTATTSGDVTIDIRIIE